MKKIENRQKILIVDDSEINRSILADMLGEEFEIIEAEDGVCAVGEMKRLGSEISLVMLDIVMPKMDGFGVLAVMNKNHWIEDIPVVMISAESISTYVERAYDLGVTDYISRPFDASVVRRRVMNTIMLYAKQKRLVDLVADQIYEKEKNSSLMVTILSHIVEFRNGESGLHVLHISTITELLLKNISQRSEKYHLSSEEISLIATASALHDIGKIAIPSEVLNKPGRFTDEEFAIMKKHSMIGANMLNDLPFHQDEPLVKVAYEICRWHHERYDGRGYPDGLAGEEIPISAQIVALADVYDALTSERVYKKAYSHEKAIEMILNGECGAFNPLLMECLTDIADSLQEEIKGNSINRSNQREMRKIADEMLRHEELSASERTLRLLEHERTKYQFFASMSQEIQFEYTSTPAMVTISEWGARRLGLNGIIMEPQGSPQVLATIGEDDLKAISKALHETRTDAPVVQHECKIIIDSEPRWHRIVCRAIWSQDEPPQYTGAIGKAVDIHQERTELIDLKHMAFHDGLTGLLNHTHAKEQIREKLIHHSDSKFALAIVDLDYFKSANDTYGHIFGDHVLKYMADKLHENIRRDDIAARVGGDEFLIFLEYQTGLDMMIDRIFYSLIGEYEGFRISVSMGIARTDIIGRDYDDLFRCADQALYEVKRKGRGQYQFYETIENKKETASALSPIDEDYQEESAGRGHTEEHN
ncbi:diguanylate cyclase [Lachnospiraceae bacterium 62-35]